MYISGKIIFWKIFSRNC